LVDAIYILIGMNTIILGLVAANTLRIGKLQGRLNNGDYLRCPFYKGGGHGKGNKSNAKAKVSG